MSIYCQKKVNIFYQDHVNTPFIAWLYYRMTALQAASDTCLFRCRAKRRYWKIIIRHCAAGLNFDAIMDPCSGNGSRMRKQMWYDLIKIHYSESWFFWTADLFISMLHVARNRLKGLYLVLRKCGYSAIL